MQVDRRQLRLVSTLATLCILANSCEQTSISKQYSNGLVSYSQRQFVGSIAGSNQCPNLAVAGVSSQTSGEPRSANDRVKIDETTGERSFEARIVGIFSCSDADSANNDLTLDFRLAKPVIDLAIKAANRKYSPRMQFNVTYRTAPDICRHQQAAGHAADEYYVNGANYFVGPGCSESLASVGQLASYWNVPICSTGYLPEVVTARFHPLTLMQLSLSVESVGEMLLELFQMYRWRHLVIVTDEKHPLHSAIRDGLLEFFHTLYMRSSSSGDTSSANNFPRHQQEPASSANGSALRSGPVTASSRYSMIAPNGFATSFAAGHLQQQQQQQQQQQLHPQQASGKTRLASEPYHINITSLNFAYSKSKPVDYEQVMLDAAAYSRIMLLLARSSTIGDLLSAAHQQGMSRGQFVFIAHELFETQMFDQQQQQQQQQQNQKKATSAGQQFAWPSAANFALSDKIEIQSRAGNTSNEQLTREIFYPLMTISLRIPTTPEFDLFRAEVAGLSEREFNYRIQPSSLKSLYSLGVAALIYDCVMLYADKVNFVLNQTQLGKIDGQTIFELTAGRTFTGALTGDLTINKAGQRVIDFTLNDFSARSLSLEPIAHFVAIERRLQFLAGKQPHWAARNQSAPRSDPRCRANDTLFCRYNEPDLDSDAALANGSGAPGRAGSSSDRFVLAVWLLIIIVLSVALTSSIIGYLVYRRFRIESELLNLWWSIKYEDILFEDEPDVMCDGKRSMSSLAISNESFNESTRQQEPSIGAGQHSLAASPHQSPSSLSLQASRQQQQQQQLSPKLTCPDQAATPASQLQPSADGQSATGLSAAQSSSTLSVTAPSVVARVEVSTAQVQSNSTSRHAATGASNQRSPVNQGASGASKLIPLLNKSGNSTGRAAGGASGSGKFTGSSTQLGAANRGRPQGGGRGADNATATNAGAQSNFKDPSISSQNKNIKLRLGTVLNGGRDETYTTKVGLYKASRVAAKHLNVKNLNINRQLLIELRQVRDLTHENLIKFIGLCPDEPNVAIVSELCTRGNLQDLLQNDTIRLDWPFRYSIINDIVDGLIHLHASPIQYHGRLKSSNCVIDNRFVVKLTDFGLPTLLAAVEELDENVNPRLLLWTAPEHLRTKRPLLSGSQKGDIYSLAIIFQEIITRCGPFECEPILCGASQVGIPIDWQASQQQQQQQPPLIRALDAGGKPLGEGRGQSGSGSGSGNRRGDNRALSNVQPFMVPIFQPIAVQHKQRLEPEEIVNLVRMGLSPPFRPYFRPDVATAGGSGAGATSDFNVGELVGIVQNCWQESPAQRPSVQSVKQQIKKMRRGCHLEGANLMDNLLQRMERYTDNLELLVEQKTAELMEEKKRSEELLYEMLPRFVVDQLKYGHSVTPEAYEAVTISFSDIKDFTSIAAQSSPIEVVNLLNQLYTEFDDCIDQYDVYKVETIGDAYMVVSGLPVRNGDQHAREIAEMSLDLLELIRNFDVAHLPHVQLELRIGIHSGPCASGVVGTRMFRYCLFGDTVNTASRMESHGEPMKIHISEESANILQQFGCFTIEPRGHVDIKGKGIMNTFWLTGRSDRDHREEAERPKEPAADPPVILALT